MTTAEIFLAEFDQEMRNTRRMLERVPDEGLDYQPHPKSMSLGRLAGHIAEMPGWGKNTVELDELNLEPPADGKFEPHVAASREAVLEFFDASVADARSSIAKVSDERMQDPWTLLVRGKPMFTMPRIAVLKSMVLNHIIHHRAQLSVYLRLRDIPIPGMYGPSADEMP